MDNIVKDNLDLYFTLMNVYMEDKNNLDKDKLNKQSYKEIIQIMKSIISCEKKYHI